MALEAQKHTEIELIAEKLAIDHWKFIHDLLKARLGSEYDSELFYKFLYISAFIHGFKHGVEYIESI